MVTPMTPEPATVHRYLADDDIGIPQGSLVVTIPADYDVEKAIVVAVLPDLRDPGCAAYPDDLGPILAEAEVTWRDAEPWGYRLADGHDPVALAATAEAQERDDAELMARSEIVEAIRTLYEAGVTREQIEAALRAAAPHAGE